MTGSNPSRDPLFTVFHIILVNFSNDQSVLCLKLCGDSTTCYRCLQAFQIHELSQKIGFSLEDSLCVASVAGILVLGKKHEMNISSRVEKTLHIA